MKEFKLKEIYSGDCFEEILEKYNSNEFGKIVDRTKDGIICTTKDNLIKIKELAIEGKKRCLTKDYLNGIKKEEILGKVFNSEEK